MNYILIRSLGSFWGTDKFRFQPPQSLICIAVTSAKTKSCHTSFTILEHQIGYPSIGTATVKIPLRNCHAKHAVIKSGTTYRNTGQGRVGLRLRRLSVRNWCWSNTSEGKEQFYKLLIERPLKFMFEQFNVLRNVTNPPSRRKIQHPLSGRGFRAKCAGC
jgi:hypothetical protein